MTRLRWAAPALTDLRQIDSWLEREASLELAVRILITIRSGATFLLDFPRGGRPLVSREYRILRVHGTPYLIAYRIAGELLEILRIFHEREDWQLES